MVFLTDEIPAYCPACGASLAKGFRDPLSRQDFYASASHSCPSCRAGYAYVDRDTIRTTADAAGSDLSDHH